MSCMWAIGQNITCILATSWYIIYMLATSQYISCILAINWYIGCVYQYSRYISLVSTPTIIRRVLLYWANKMLVSISVNTKFLYHWMWYWLAPNTLFFVSSCKFRNNIWSLCIFDVFFIRNMHLHLWLFILLVVNY